MVDLNPILSLIALNVKDINPPIKKTKIVKMDEKNTTQWFAP